MHGEDAGVGKEEVQGGEDRLLDLPGVAGSGDEGHPLGEIQDDGRLAPGAVDDGIGLEAGEGENGEVRDELPVFVP